jgi:hypothetical protein
MSTDSVVPTIRSWLQDRLADTYGRAAIVRNGVTYTPFKSFDSAGLHVTIYRSTSEYYVEAGSTLIGKYALNITWDDLLTYIAQDYARIMQQPRT